MLHLSPLKGPFKTFRNNTETTVCYESNSKQSTGPQLGWGRRGLNSGFPLKGAFPSENVYPWEEIPHPPLAGGYQVNETTRLTRQKSHFLSNIAHNEFL